MRNLLVSGVAAAVLSSLLWSSCSGAPRTEKPAPDAGQSTPKTEAPAPTTTRSAPEQPLKMPDETPDVFKIKFTTTAGDFVVEAHRAWAPLGTDRFYELVKRGFYEEIAFFRVIPGFMAQFGIHGDPEEAGEWRGHIIDDDPVKQSNTRGMISFASAGPNTRTTQMFINFADNSKLDAMGFAPFAKVVEGMDVVDKIYKVGEGAPQGPGPSQRWILSEGNALLKKHFPKIDYITGATYVK